MPNPYPRRLSDGDEQNHMAFIAIWHKIYRVTPDGEKSNVHLYLREENSDKYNLKGCKTTLKFI